MRGGRFRGCPEPDIIVPIWEKFLLLVPLANINALTRQTLGRYRADPEPGRWSRRACARPGGRPRRGRHLPPDAAEQALATIRAMPDHHMTSMGNDLLRGNRLELPWLAGKVVELGRRHGIPTPVTASSTRR